MWVVALAAGAAAQDPPRGVGGREPAVDYRHLILAAEDRRTRIPEGLHTPILDRLRLELVEDARILIKIANSPDPAVRDLAIRALGRYESREFITDLLPYVRFTPAASQAVVRAFRGEPLRADRGGEQMRAFMDVVMSDATREGNIGLAAQVLGELRYDDTRLASSAVTHLHQLLRRGEATKVGPAPAVSGIADYARRSSRQAPLTEEILERLRYFARRPHTDLNPAIEATRALFHSGALDDETIKVAAVAEEEERRYWAAIALGRSASVVEDFTRLYLLKKLLVDPSVGIRIEAARAWARQASRTEGCNPIQDLLKDKHERVRLVALELLGDFCRDDETITDRLSTEVKSPPNQDWHWTVQAFVSLAKRSPERAAVPLYAAFVSHPVWQVRMYGARVASMLKEAPALERLAADAEDNVREAALATLRGVKGAASDPLFVAALKRDDYQLLRRAALELKGATSSPELANALLGALLRVTAEKKDTSRDTRLALLERLAELGTADLAEHLAPLLRDFDIQVALAAAGVLQGWTGRQQVVDPQLEPRPPLPTDSELAEDLDAVVEMESGKKFAIRLNVDLAPLTVTRFKRLVRANYYNGLTFHRVVNNFVIQGGSPRANEYAGDGPFMRDELGGHHGAFTVGVSTRGRDTGDAQFFINLVANERLDDDYTVFGAVCELRLLGSSFAGPGKEAVEAIVEGDRISSISLEKWDGCRTGERRVIAK